MEKYLKPEMEIVALSGKETILTSGGCDCFLGIDDGDED